MISNTSCLIALDNISGLSILRNRYGKILITPEVAKEFGKPLDSWFSVMPVDNRNYLNILSYMVDIGAAST